LPVGAGAPWVSKAFEDVDNGESRSFAPGESCILPFDGQSIDGVFVAPQETWTCSEAGTPGPISFTVVMAEEDSGFFHDCLSGQAPPILECAADFHRPYDLPDWNDDLIGRHTVEFTAEELAFAMPNVGDYIEPVITLGPCHDERAGEGACTTGTAIPDPAEYTFTYRITRVPVQLQAPVLSDRAAQIAVPTR